MVRHGMRALLESTPDLMACGEAATPDEALAAVRTYRPDVVCLDLMLGAADGFALIRELRAGDPQARILVLSVREEDSFAERCVQAGALGYAMKSESNETLLTALRRVADGKMHLSSRMAMTMLNHIPRTTPARKGVPSLTERELQVFQLIGSGWSTRQIAERLGIGVKTVETHRENIKNKLRLEHSTALVREATVWATRSA